MNSSQRLRAIGVLCLVATFAIYSIQQPAVDVKALFIVATLIVALISPETVDELPYLRGK